MRFVVSVHVAFCFCIVKVPVTSCQTQTDSSRTYWKPHTLVKSSWFFAFQFSESLSKLMVTLNSTVPHYIRCIKPNDRKAPFEFNPQRSIQQLRACGVLETVRISAAGYPSRWSYAEFFYRYRMLVKFSSINRKKPRATIELILKTFIKVSCRYQMCHAVVS